MPDFLNHLIDCFCGYAVLIGAIICTVYSVIHILRPQKRYIITSGDVIKIIAKKERKS